TKSDEEDNYPGPGGDEESGLDSQRACTSDSELYSGSGKKAMQRSNRSFHYISSSRSTSPELPPNSPGGWILVGKEGEIQPLQVRPVMNNQFSIVHDRELLGHDPYALVKCCECLAFLVRDLAHITPYNFENCVHCLRTFVEASLNGNSTNAKIPSPEDEENIKKAKACILDCHIEQLITESKFLRLDSLLELVKALIFASHGPDGQGTTYDEDTTVFFLELLLKVVIQNRDRVGCIWQGVRDHIYSLVMGAAACERHFLMERSVVGLLRLAKALMRLEDMSPVVLQSLRMLLLLKPQTLSRISRQIAYGLFEILKTSAANIHSDTDWSIIFTLLECVGAGAHPPRIVGEIGRPVSGQ
ncbi:hypothetical protein J437_LFUL005496, partial [Ladona fulva]